MISTAIVYRFGAEAVDLAQLHALLKESYWAKDRPLAQISRAVRNSFCISAWEGQDGGRLVGFARLLTDYAVHAYLADVIVAPAHRGHGIGTTMVRKLVDHEAMATCRICLHTRDAHGVYRPLGFADSTDMRKPARRVWQEGP